MGGPGFVESLIPIWGSGRAAINDFQQGSYGWGALQAAAAASDVFLAGAAAKSLAKGGLKLGAELAGVQANRIAGNAFRDEIAQALQAEGRDVGTEVYKATPFGRRFIDIEVSQNGTVLGGIETKLGNSPYSASQRAKDTWLWLMKGYRVDVVRGP